ncbi:hypothetical protein GCM10023196_036350 [Actinoallomurus vinaceus]|uniref:Uncharacterized protein n=1 Tax=Actinoallomurus vinaceus TaxID=1080074 RepID=A0ABP8UBT5_9ACTN
MTTAEWPYDADRDDPLTQLRVPVAPLKPNTPYLVSFDRGSAARPNDVEASVIASYIDYERQYWFPVDYQRRLQESPLDVDDYHNTMTLHKYGPDHWAYRRATWEYPHPLLDPAKDQTPDKHLSIVALLDQVRVGPEIRWARWKRQRPELFEIAASAITSPAELLALPLQARYDGMILAHRVWPDDVLDTTPAKDAIAREDHDALIRAFGVPRAVTFTSDGRDAHPKAWCECHPEQDGAPWVRYERWTSDGREAHGYVCPTITCRRLLQSG